MSRHDAAPTHGYVITSHINSFVVRLCLLVTACALVAGATMVMRLNANCHDTAAYDWKLFGYEVRVGFSKDPAACASW